jgi:NTE family protein
VLCGGAALGLANIGVLEALHERDLYPDCIAGSSMGAIIAALHALGHSPGAIREVAGKLKPASVMRMSSRPFRSGLHGGLLEQQLETHVGPLIGEATIADCAVPFVCVAGRVREPIRWERLLLPGFVEHLRERVEAYIFPESTRIMDAVRASSAIPVVFSPARVGDDEFIDLVHFGPIPARSLRTRHSPEIVIATDTQPDYKRVEPFFPAPLRTFLAAGRAETAQSIAVCDLLLRPQLPASMLRFDRSADFVSAGHQVARENMAHIEALLGLKASDDLPNRS